MCAYNCQREKFATLRLMTDAKKPVLETGALRADAIVAGGL